MSAVFGYIKKLNSTEEDIECFLASSYNKSFPAGKKLSIVVKNGPVYDYAVVDDEKEAKICLDNLKNNEAMFCIVKEYSNDIKQYPLVLDDNLFAMHGNISSKKFEDLKTKYNDISCSLCDAYMFRELKENFLQWYRFDNKDASFVGWWLHTNSILVHFFTKDYPLYFKYTKEVIYFSSFKEDENFNIFSNEVKIINLETYLDKNYSKFKNLANEN